MNTKESVEQMLAMIFAGMQLEPSKMDIGDQLRLFAAYADFSNALKPFVIKYGGSVEDIQKKYEETQKKEQTKDLMAGLAAYILAKGGVIGGAEKSEETVEEERKES